MVRALEEIPNQPQVTQVLISAVNNDALPSTVVVWEGEAEDRIEIAVALQEKLTSKNIPTSIHLEDDSFDLSSWSVTDIYERQTYHPSEFDGPTLDLRLNPRPIETKQFYKDALDLAVRIARSTPNDVVEKSRAYIRTYDYSTLITGLSHVLNNVLLFQVGALSYDPSEPFKLLFATVDRLSATKALKKLWDASTGSRLDAEIAGPLLCLFLAEILNSSFDMSTTTPISSVEDVPLTLEEMERLLLLAIEDNDERGTSEEIGADG